MRSRSVTVGTAIPPICLLLNYFTLGTPTSPNPPQSPEPSNPQGQEAGFRYEALGSKKQNSTKDETMATSFRNRQQLYSQKFKRLARWEEMIVDRKGMSRSRKLLNMIGRRVSNCIAIGLWILLNVILNIIVLIVKAIFYAIVAILAAIFSAIFG